MDGVLVQLVDLGIGVPRPVPASAPVEGEGALAQAVKVLVGLDPLAADDGAGGPVLSRAEGVVTCAVLILAVLVDDVALQVEKRQPARRFGDPADEARGSDLDGGVCLSDGEVAGGPVGVGFGDGIGKEEMVG